jgi:hypothetical protein
MQNMLFLVAMAGLIFVIDAIHFGGRYRNELWQDTTSKGQAFTREVEYQIHRLLR